MVAEKRRDAGFTLIELMVVIIILGVLAVGVVPNLIGRTYDAKLSKSKSDIASLETAISLYRLDMGRFPSTEQGLDALVVAPDSGTRWRKGGYLEKKKLPKDPWGNPYVYLYPGSHNDYDIISYGADGEPGGEGEDQDINSWQLDEITPP